MGFYHVYHRQLERDLAREKWTKPVERLCTIIPWVMVAVVVYAVLCPVIKS